MAAEDLFIAFASVPGTPTPGAQASASANDGSDAAEVRGIHHSNLSSVIDVSCREYSLNTVEFEMPMLTEPINWCFEDDVLLSKINLYYSSMS